MAITLDGTNGITTPDVDADGLTVDTNTLHVDSTNNRVGIGTSSPTEALDVNGTIAMSGAGTDDRHIEIGAGRTGNGNSYVDLISDTTYTDFGARFIRHNSGPNAGTTIEHRGTGELALWAFDAGALKFGTSNTERMRIESSGRLLVGTTAYSYGYDGTNSIQLDGHNIIRTATTTSASNAMVFNNPNGQVGYINTSGSSTIYATSSDYRLKENVVDLTGATGRLKQIPVHRFNFIADADTTVDGFIAHEVQAIVPEAVTGSKDEVDADGNAVYQGIDQSKLVPLLTAALQEAVDKIEALEARIEVLEAKP